MRLLQRTTRKLSLTEAGEQSTTAIAWRCASRPRRPTRPWPWCTSEPRGTVRVTCPVTLAQTTIGPLLPLFLQRHPQVRIDMQVTNRVVDLVQEGVDVALRVRPTLDDSGSLVVKNLGPTSGAAGGQPRSCCSARAGPRSLEDLRSLPHRRDVGRRWPRAAGGLLGPGGRESDLQHQPVYTADDLLTLKLAVLQGTGMGVLPDYLCARELQDGRLVEVLPGWAPRTGIVHAVFPSRRGMVPAVRRLLDFLGEHVSRRGRCGLPCPLSAARRQRPARTPAT